VPLILQKPTAIFQGLTRDEDEDRRGYGWRCYCAIPENSYQSDGTAGFPYPGQVYLVFVNDEGVAYNLTAVPEVFTMTEQQWQNASDPHVMLEFLQNSGRPSARKLRLFAVACSRRIWNCVDALGRAAVDVAERFADRSAGPDELRAARLACQGAGGQAAWYAAATDPAIAARNAARSACAGVAGNALLGSPANELLAQANLLREIFGNHCRHLAVDPEWQTPAVIRLAQTIYGERAFRRMPALAEQLEQAGCANKEVLSHCRGPEPHVRGCWLIDQLLGKD
jgi:hypothetical protein